MIDPNALHEALMTRLKALPGVGERVHDGYVPDKLPESPPGFVRPYLVVHSGLGSDLPGERDLTGLTDVTVLDWASQITCVGATPTIARQVAQQVRVALTNLPMGGGWLGPDPDAFRVKVPIHDDQASPARFFLPLPWRLITN